MTPIYTQRLRLIPATAALLRADLEGREALALAAGCQVSEDWPPELYDAQAIQYTLDLMERSPAHLGWPLYYIALPAPESALIGVIGYKGPPDLEGQVEIGYSVLPSNRRLGYAAEAAAALVQRAWAHPDVKAVIAETLPELQASIGVLEKCGFEYIGEGSEPGVIRYRLLRKG
jgi:RimJ/RimL family protein N-acetyltransferase